MSELNDITVDTYGELQRWRDDFFKPAGLNFLVVKGTPGTGKSVHFRSAATASGGDVVFHTGAMSGPHAYRAFYEHRDQAIILDDVDGLFKHDDNVNLLKVLCQTDAVKRVAWRKQNWQMRKDNIPESFNTTTRVCVLTNKIATIEENLGAVLDRAFVINFSPSPAEVHKHVGTWFKDDEVYAFIGEHLGMLPYASMRWYVKAAALKGLRRDWQGYLLNSFTKNRKLAITAKVLSDKTLTTCDARVQKFAELGGGSRDTFMRWQRQYREIQQAG